MAKMSAQALILLSVLCLGVAGLELGENGGYRLKVGINRPEPTFDLSPHINNLKQVLQRFSIQLFIATKERFFIHSVEIFVQEGSE
jgi:hypothetical protein